MPPISTVWDWGSTNLCTERHLVRLLQASLGSFSSVALSWLPNWARPVPLGKGQDRMADFILPPVNAILATFFCRCWHWMFIFTAWSTTITIIHQLKICNLSIQSTLLTVLGIVLGCTYIPFLPPGNALTERTHHSRNFPPNFVRFRALQRRPQVLVYHRVQLSYVCACCVVPCSQKCGRGWGGRCREAGSYPRGEEDCAQSRRRLRVSPAPLDTFHSLPFIDHSASLSLLFDTPIVLR